MPRKTGEKDALAEEELPAPRMLAQEGVRLWFSNRHAITYSVYASLQPRQRLHRSYCV